MFLKPDVDVNIVGPQVHVVYAGEVPGGEGACSAFQVSVSLVTTDADRLAVEPRTWPNAGPKVPRGQPVQVQQRQHLSDLRVLRAHGGKPRRTGFRSPVSGSMRRSLTRGAVTPTPRRRRSASPTVGGSRCAPPAADLLMVLGVLKAADFDDRSRSAPTSNA